MDCSSIINIKSDLFINTADIQSLDAFKKVALLLRFYIKPLYYYLYKFNLCTSENLCNDNRKIQSIAAS